MDSSYQFPFSFVRIDHPGDYEKENIVFRAEEHIDSLNNFLLVYLIENIPTGLPDYERVRILTFDNIGIEKGTFLKIYTRSNEYSNTKEFEKSDLIESIYWGLSNPIWSVPLSSYELIHRNTSISGGLLRD